jgi:hypothetical protein
MKPVLVALRTWIVSSAFVGGVWSASALALAGPAVAELPLPSLAATDLAHGPFAAMHMLLAKTFLKVEVLTVDVRFSAAVQAKFKDLAGGQALSSELEQSLAQTAMAAQRVVVRTKFRRDVGLGQWLDGVRENMEHAVKAGLISAATEKQLADGLPTVFAALKDRGFRDKDSVFYDVRPGSVRTTAVAADGSVLVDQVSHEPEVSRVVLSSYFAPGSEFRRPLLKSLFK